MKKSFLSLILILLFFVSFICVTGCGKEHISEEVVLQMRMILEKEVVIGNQTHEWNNASWDQSKLITYGNYQYVTYWDFDLKLVFARRNLITDEIQTVKFPHVLASKSVVTGPEDGHRNTAIGISPIDGRIHLAYDHHMDPINYRVSREDFITNPPETISIEDFTDEIDIVREKQVTYPRFFNDSKGCLYMIFRDGGAGRGDTYMYSYSEDDNTWTRRGIIFSRYGTHNGFTSRCAYETDVIFDANDRLHITWTWRPGHGDQSDDHDFNYAYSDDYGFTWKNNEGAQIADLTVNDSIRVDDQGLVVVDAPPNSWIVNSGAMVLDSKNQPHVFTARSPVVTNNPSKAAVTRIHYWRTEDGKWHEQYIEEPSKTPRTWRQRGDIFIDESDTIFAIYLEGDTLWCSQTTSPDWQEWSRYAIFSRLDAPLGDHKYDRFRWKSTGVLSIPITQKIGGRTRFIIRDYVVK
jgi:hypothetical protein